MLSEVGTIRPSTLILWKTDRLARNLALATFAKSKIRDAGCAIEFVAETTPENTPEGKLIENFFDSLAEFYSDQLSINTMRGMRYNAERAGFNGHRVLGYQKSVDGRYEIDPNTAPVVQRIFTEYADGRPMSKIIADLNSQGIRSSNGNKFTHNGLRHILHNKRYLGIYKYDDIEIPGGMPQLVDQETFDKVQKRFEQNKRDGSRQARGMNDDGSPRYWLTGKLFCGECGESMHGISGTGKHGERHYYYACKNRRKHKCTKRNVRKEVIESQVAAILRHILTDTENRASIAVDISSYYREHYVDTHYLEGLKAELASTGKALRNLVRSIEQGLPFSPMVADRVRENEERKQALEEAIEAEEARSRAALDEYSIRALFERYADADLEDPEVCDAVLDYFVDKIFLYDDHLVVIGWFTEQRLEIPRDFIGSGEDGFNGFEYLDDSSSGFVYFADGGTT